MKQFQVAEILSQFETYGATITQVASHKFKDQEVYETYELFGSYPDAKELYSYLCGTSILVVFDYSDPVQLARDLAVERNYSVKVITRNVEKVVSFWFGR